MAFIREQVIVNVRAITKGFNAAMKGVNGAVKNVQANVASMGNVLGLSQQEMNKWTQSGIRSTTMLGRFTHWVRRATQGSRGFRMELLGVMFFGMMLQRIFMQMLRPAAETFGLFEIFSTILTLLFLPIMPELLDFMLKILNWVQNMPDETKKLIGKLAILGVVFGTILLAIGSLGLGIGSLLKLFAFLGPVIESVAGVAVPGLAAITTPLWAIIAAVASVIAFFYVMYVAIKENFMNIQANVSGFIESLKTMFGGLINRITGKFDLLKAIVSGDLDAVLAALSKIGGGEIEFFTGLAKYLYHGWSIIVKTVLRVIKGIYDIVKEIFTRIFGWLDKHVFKGLLSKFYNWGKNIIMKIVEGIKSKAKAVTNALFNALGPFGSFVKGGASSLVKSIGIGKIGSKNDFIWRPGSGAQVINPNDTLVGFKGNNPLASGSNITVANTYNVNVSDKNEFERILTEHDRKLLDNIRRNTA